jgi:hypothetical protein
MSCGCAKRARRAFEQAGYSQEGDWWVKGDDRVHDDDIEKHHLVETIRRPGVVTEAVKVATADLLDKLAV